MNKNHISFVSCILLIFLLASCATTQEDMQRKKKAAALRKLGEVYMNGNKNAAAFRKLKEAETLAPDDPYVHFSLGIFYFNKERYDLAIEHYQKCLKFKPDFASVRNNIGLAYMKQGEYDTAIAYFKELTDNYVYATPHFPLCNLGQTYYYKGDYPLAEKYLLESLDLQPKFVIAIHWLGRTRLALGKTTEAIQSFEKASHLNPFVPEIYFDLGNAYQTIGKNKKSKDAYQKVIELDSEGGLADQARKMISR